ANWEFAPQPPNFESGKLTVCITKLAHCGRRQRHAAIENYAKLRARLHFCLFFLLENAGASAQCAAEYAADQGALAATGNATDDRAAGGAATDEYRVSFPVAGALDRAFVVGIHAVSLQGCQRSIDHCSSTIRQPDGIKGNRNVTGSAFPSAVYLRHTSANP